MDQFRRLPGIGPKTATKLIAQFGSLAACLAQADRIESDSLREKVRAGRAIDTTLPDYRELDDIVLGR